MTDPTTITLAVAGGAAIGGAASGAAKYLTETALSQGQKWLAAFFKDHHEKALRKAEDNTGAFLNALALKVDQLEQTQQLDRSLIDRALEDPHFGALLHDSLVGSAQTNSSEKHDLLASLIAARLTAQTESVLAVASKMANNAIINCTATQLHILGFIASLAIRADSLPSFDKVAQDIRGEKFAQFVTRWLEHRYSPYLQLEIKSLDLLHLEAVSCITLLRFGKWDLQKHLNSWGIREWHLTVDYLDTFPAGSTLKRLWKQGGKQITLTSIGTLIGTMVSDRLCGARATSFDGWSHH